MNTDQHSLEDFSLSDGGPFNRGPEYNKQGKIVNVILCIAWLPIVIITAIEGTLYSGTYMPFLKDAGMQARLLIALPLLILIKPAIDNKVIAVAKYLSGALMSGKIFSQLHCEEQGDGRIQH